ncbi:hypothetical protein HOY82DRAFT_592546 [Tuber indicum]|nr:hypothetical protein HOY82DRAFT_592546 [Tuber indicum]
MKPAQHALALSVAGLCSTAYALPQIPYYASKFPQHPQNLGHAGNYPKYWQGETYAPGSNREPIYYDWNPEPEPERAPPRPDFAGTRHPAKGAIKYYGAQNFPTKSVAEPTGADAPKPEPENASSSNIKITNDTPSGPVKNDKSYTRIRKSSSVGGPGPAPAIAEKKKAVTDKGDAGSTTTTSGEDVSDDLWNSFSFGVVSDTLNYHDPYEGREGEYKRKTNAISKIEKMMDKEYSAKEIADASSTSTPSNSRIRRRGLQHRRRAPNPEPITYQKLTTIKEEEEEEKYYEPEYDNDHIRLFGYDIRGYDLPTLKLIDAYEREAREAGVFRPYMYNPHIPDLTIDSDGNWKTPAARQQRLAKRNWPEHIRAKAEKMMHSARNMQEKGQLVIDNDPTYQKSLKEKKELASTQGTAKPETAKEEEDPLDLLPSTKKGKGSVVPNRKASMGGMSNTTSHPPQNTQTGSSAAKAPKHTVQKQPSKLNSTAAAHRKDTNRALLNKQMLLQKKKKHPMPIFPKQGIFKGGPEYPPGTIITRRKKCDDEGKCVTVAQPVDIPAPAAGAKTFVVKQITDGQTQIHPCAAPQPIEPAPVHPPVHAAPHTITAPKVKVPTPSPEVRVLKQAPAPAPAPKAAIQKAPTPQPHQPATAKESAQPHLVVTYVPVVKPGHVHYPEEITEKKVEAPKPKLEKVEEEKEVVRMPCGCECSSCSSCEYDTAPVGTCPCGDPECGKGPGVCTCGAPGCNCNERARGPRSNSKSYSKGVKDVSRKSGPGRNTSGASSGGHTHRRGYRSPSTPAELEAFWRKQVPGAFKND